MGMRGWNPAAFDRWLTTEPNRGVCEWCGEEECDGEKCECPHCEGERAAQDDYDASVERARDSSG